MEKHNVEEKKSVSTVEHTIVYKKVSCIPFQKQTMYTGNMKVYLKLLSLARCKLDKLYL